MEEDNLRRLQRLYEAAETSTTNQESNTSAPAQNALPVADDILHFQLRQQHQLQQDLSVQTINERQTREDDMSWLQRNNPNQQLQQLSNYGISSLENVSALRGTQAFEQSMYQAIDAGTGTLLANQNTDPAMSLLIRNIQQRNIESEVAARNQQYREVMLNAAMSRGNVGNMDVGSLLNETSGMSFLDQRRLGLSSRQQMLAMYQNSASAQNLPLLTDPAQLSRTVENIGQLDAPSSPAYLRSNRTNDQGPSLSQQLLLDEYLRSQQAGFHALRQREMEYQNQQLLDMYGEQSRLAFLMNQRQQLEQQAPSEPLTVAALAEPLAVAARNISLKNDEPVDEEEAVTKIRKVEEFIEKPKRPLSAYNIFFRQERQKLLGENENESITEAKEGVDDDDKKPAAVVDIPGSKKRKRGKPHHKVTFEQMAKIIGQRWKELESDESRKKYFQDIAQKDKERYQAEIVAWKKQRNALSSKYRKKSGQESKK